MVPPSPSAAGADPIATDPVCSPLLEDLASIACTARGRDLMHAPWSCLLTTERARAGGPSPWRCSLDGDWRFHLAPSPQEVPAGCELPGFDDAAWRTMPVPANWELHGAGEAIYRNIAYPFPPDPPHPPARNPTGCYRTSISLPPGWDTQRVWLELGAADSACHLWLNGELIGWSTDSKLAATFELTGRLRPGANLLAVRVYRWSAAAYLEKQDYWHLSGLQRSVLLLAKPPRHLRDWCVRTILAPGGASARLEVRAWMEVTRERPGLNAAGAIDYPGLAGWTISAELRDPDGHLVPGCPVASPVARRSPMYGPQASGRHEELGSALLILPLVQPRLWSAEEPQLYTLVLTLVSPDGREVDAERQRVGVRQVAIRDGVLELNGRRLVLRGVNRHEFHPKRGRAVTRADMREDLLAMKRLNFNAVRTCHYPDHEAWYELCDELGMYVVDETNLETHGLEAQLSRDPAWATAYLERAVRMLLRDRNHACIIIWSLGNESAYGPHHAAMAAWLREADPTRPVQYESGYPPAAVSDLLAPMYPQLDWVRRELARPEERRPLVMCEYAYAKGNSSGNLGEFWDLVWELPRFQGGFLWDWRDKALLDGQDAQGRRRYRYGEPSEEPAHVERMCMNGVVGPDLVPHPGAWEIQQAQAPLRLAAAPSPDAQRIELQLHNRHLALSLAHLRLEWRIQEQGATLASGVLPAPPLPAGAQGSCAIALPPLPPALPGRERWCEVAAVLATDQPWAPAGHAIVHLQVAMPTAPRVVPAAAPGQVRTHVTTLADADAQARQHPVSSTVSATGIRLQAGAVLLRIDRASGSIHGLARGGRELLAAPLLPCLFRAPTDIDYATGEAGHAHLWRGAGLDRLEMDGIHCEAARLAEDCVQVRMRSRLHAPGTSTAVERLSVVQLLGSGDVLIEEQWSISAEVATLPRIGLSCELAGCDRWLWYGRGPHENYPDRLDSTRVDRYQQQVADNLTPYLFPQECGLRCQLRYLAVVDAEGAGLAVAGEPWLHASALPVPLAQLDRCTHAHELAPTGTVHLHLDHAHAGLGGDTGWTRNIHPPYLLPPGRYRFCLRLGLLEPGQDPGRWARTRSTRQVVA